jgi:hypothetical protein
VGSKHCKQHQNSSNNNSDRIFSQTERSNIAVLKNIKYLHNSDTLLEEIIKYLPISTIDDMILKYDDFTMPKNAKSFWHSLYMKKFSHNVPPRGVYEEYMKNCAILSNCRGTSQILAKAIQYGWENIIRDKVVNEKHTSPAKIDETGMTFLLRHTQANSRGKDIATMALPYCKPAQLSFFLKRLVMQESNNESEDPRQVRELVQRLISLGASKTVLNSEERKKYGIANAIDVKTTETN